MCSHVRSIVINPSLLYSVYEIWLTTFATVVNLLAHVLLFAPRETNEAQVKTDVCIYNIYHISNDSQYTG